MATLQKIIESKIFFWASLLLPMVWFFFVGLTWPTVFRGPEVIPIAAAFFSALQLLALYFGWVKSRPIQVGRWEIVLLALMLIYPITFLIVFTGPLLYSGAVVLCLPLIPVYGIAYGVVVARKTRLLWTGVPSALLATVSIAFYWVIQVAVG